MGVAAAVAGGSALLSAGASIYGATTAANAQKSAAASANALQGRMFDTTQANLSPFIQNGGIAQNKLLQMLQDPNGLLKPFNPTQADLESTPGYQFTRTQGINAVNNANSAKGWGLSGPGQKGIADYVTGLASNTYQQQYQNYWDQNKNIFGMLYQPASLGESAAAGQGQIAQGTGQSMADTILGAGNASAASSLGSANAIANAPVNAMAEYNLLAQMMNGGGGGTTNPNPWGTFGGAYW